MEPLAPSPLFDAVDVFPDLLGLRLRVAEGDLPGALDVLTAHRRLSGTDHAVALGVIADTPGVDEQLGAILADDPTHREGRAVRAHRALAPGSTGLAGVDLDLVRMCAEDPTDPVPWFLRLVTARDRRVTPHEALRRWDRLAAVDPHHLPAQRVLLQCLRSTPDQEWQDVLATARRLADGAGPGSPEHSLLATAHLAHWRETTDGSLEELRRPEAVAEVEQAADHFLAAPCTSAYAWVVAHTEFAVFFGLAERRGRSAAHFRALGPALARVPWDAAGAHHDRLDTIRRSVLADGPRR